MGHIALTLFASIGGAASLLALYAIGCLVFAVSKSSDIKTALTPQLPKDAFAQQVVWITGGSSGIGKEMALLLAIRNARLILSARNKADLEATADECRARNPKVKVQILPLDLNDKASLPGKVKEAVSFFGPIEILVNNGGISTRVMAVNCSTGTDDLLTQVDYLSHVAITKALAPSMENSENVRRIINTCSVCSKTGVPARTAYCGAKFALKGWMDAFRMECVIRGNTNIHILNVCLGSTNTSLPFRCAVNVDEKKGTVETFDKKDENLIQGLDPTFVAERMLSASFHRSVDECWLAKGKELVLLYANQLIPNTTATLVASSAGKKYVKTKDSPE